MAGHAEQFNIRDDVPGGAEIKAVVGSLRWTNLVGIVEETPIPGACQLYPNLKDPSKPGTIRYAAHVQGEFELRLTVHYAMRVFVEGEFQVALELKALPFDRQTLHFDLEGSKSYKMEFVHVKRGSTRFKNTHRQTDKMKQKGLLHSWENRDDECKSTLVQWEFCDKILAMPYKTDSGRSASQRSYAGVRFMM